MVASTHAGAERLRTRVESLLDDPHGELWVGTWDSIGERMLREYSDAAGLDPFFEVLGPAERLAMLLDRLDDLPLRRHEIRGNPAGLLARLLERIDALKAGADAPDAELADLVAAHDRILAATGNLDRGDVFLTLNRLHEEREDVRDALAERFVEVMVDELEDTTIAQRALLAALAEAEPAPRLRARAGAAPSSAAGTARSTPTATRSSSSTCSATPSCGSGAAPTSAPRPRPSPARSRPCSRAGSGRTTSAS